MQKLNHRELRSFLKILDKPMVLPYWNVLYEDHLEDNEDGTIYHQYCNDGLIRKVLFSPEVVAPISCKMIPQILSESTPTHIIVEAKSVEIDQFSKEEIQKMINRFKSKKDLTRQSQRMKHDYKVTVFWLAVLVNNYVNR